MDPSFVADYRAATEDFLAAAALAEPADLDRRRAGGWSARQVIHHVADSETQSYARLRRLLAEPGTLIQGYDEGAWAACATLGYEELPVEHALDVIRAVRTASADLLERLAPEDLALEGRHSESGAYSVATWLETYTRHPREHARQLAEALAAPDGR
ncbi:MAG TPA: DinB family protein [Acidimicrobiales bacterium]|nr:MAG: hypothetical protein B7Z69_07680 [Actinobacteria bacterium 21-73-9]HQU25484.1 DinB family protein [Acidimicrobiales bacterium]